MAFVKRTLSIILFVESVAITFAENVQGEQEYDQKQLIGQLLERMNVLEGNAAIQQQMIMDLQDEMERRDVKYNKMVEGLQSEVLGLKKELKAIKQSTAAKDRRIWKLLHTHTRKTSKCDEVDDDSKNSSPAQQMHRRNAPTNPQIRQIQPDSPVAFSAGLTKVLSNVGTNQNIIFDTVETNIGNGYNQHHGIFIAPVSGTYVFFTTLYASHNYGYSSLHCHFVINGAGKYAIYAESSSAADSDTGSQMLIKHLNQGDDVAVQTISAVAHVLGNNNMYSTFTGFLLQQDESVANLVG